MLRQLQTFVGIFLPRGNVHHSPIPWRQDSKYELIHHPSRLRLIPLRNVRRGWTFRLSNQCWRNDLWFWHFQWLGGSLNRKWFQNRIAAVVIKPRCTRILCKKKGYRESKTLSRDRHAFESKLWYHQALLSRNRRQKTHLWTEGHHIGMVT